MKVKNYFPRICDALLSKKLRHSGAVLVTGPEWCGKTSTALVASESVIYMQEPDECRAYKIAADTKPSTRKDFPIPSPLSRKKWV